MVFKANLAFAAELLVLVASTALIIWTAKGNVPCKLLGKVVGYFALVFAVLAMLCTGYHSIKSCKGWGSHGYGKHYRHGKKHRGYKGHEGCEKCDKGEDCPYCEQGKDCPYCDKGDCPHKKSDESLNEGTMPDDETASL